MKKLKIRIRSYDAKVVDQATRKIVEASQDQSSNISGPIPLPTKKEIFTILRSVHINKKSREQFEMRTHKRLVVIDEPTAKLMEDLKRMELPSGVDFEIFV